MLSALIPCHSSSGTELSQQKTPVPHNLHSKVHRLPARREQDQSATQERQVRRGGHNCDLKIHVGGGQQQFCGML